MIDILSFLVGAVVGAVCTVGIIVAWILPDVVKKLIEMARKGEI